MRWARRLVETWRTLTLHMAGHARLARLLLWWRRQARATRSASRHDALEEVGRAVAEAGRRWLRGPAMLALRRTSASFELAMEARNLFFVPVLVSIGYPGDAICRPSYCASFCRCVVSSWYIFDRTNSISPIWVCTRFTRCWSAWTLAIECLPGVMGRSLNDMRDMLPLHRNLSLTPDQHDRAAAPFRCKNRLAPTQLFGQRHPIPSHHTNKVRNTRTLMFMLARSPRLLLKLDANLLQQLRQSATGLRARRHAAMRVVHLLFLRSVSIRSVVRMRCTVCSSGALLVFTSNCARAADRGVEIQVVDVRDLVVGIEVVPSWAEVSKRCMYSPPSSRRVVWQS